LLTQNYISVAVSRVPYLIVSTLFHYHVVSTWYSGFVFEVNPLNVELNPIYHLLVLLENHLIVHVSRIRVKIFDAIGVFVVLVTPDDPRLILKSWLIQESLKILFWTASKRRITEMRSSVDSVLSLLRNTCLYEQTLLFWRFADRAS